jgi:hypothetical protein
MIAHLLLVATLTSQPPLVIELARQIESLSKQIQELVAPSSVTVSSTTSLQTALANGGTVVLTPGVYKGNFVITKPTALVGPVDAVLEPLDVFTETLVVSGSDVSVDGLTIRNGLPDRTVVTVTGDNVTFTGTEVIAGVNGGHRGFALLGRNNNLDEVQVRNFWEAGRDSQAVWINGPGPYTVRDSFLEASGENILLGGADPAPGVVPSDVLISGNTISKPLSFVSLGVVKNSFEVKNGRRVVFENNVIDGNWYDGQDGTPIVLTVRNQDGACTWCVVDEVTIRANRIVNTPHGYAVSILGLDYSYPSQQTKVITIEGNLFRDSQRGFKVGNGVQTLLTITKNTLPGITHSFFTFYTSGSPEAPMTPLVFSANVFRAGEYSVTGDGTPVGPTTLGIYTIVQGFQGNVMEQSAERAFSWPNGNTIVPPGGLLSLLSPQTFKLLSGGAGW